jgi:hypothetical protein
MKIFVNDAHPIDAIKQRFGVSLSFEKGINRCKNIV